MRALSAGGLSRGIRLSRDCHEGLDEPLGVSALDSRRHIAMLRGGLTPPVGWRVTQLAVQGNEAIARLTIVRGLFEERSYVRKSHRSVAESGRLSLPYGP